ncbi:MAG: MFS transporter [Dehalococcoidia bacterium]
MAVEPQDIRLFANHSFRRLIESRAVGQVGQSAMLFTLLIIVVEKTDSSLHSTMLVTAFILPSILLGLPAGGLADILPRRGLLVSGYLARAALVIAMVYYDNDLWNLYLLAFVFSCVGQVTGPAESASLPGLVGRDRLTAANSWMVLSVTLGQAAGAIVLAPVAIKLAGTSESLATSVLAFAAAAFVVSAAIDLNRRVEDDGPRDRTGLAEAMTAGWRVLRTSRRAFLALVYLTVVGTLSKALAVLAPRYTRDVLDISAENAVFVVAPAAIGAIIALAFTPPLARLFGALRIAAVGFILYVLSIAGLGLVVLVRDNIVENLQLAPGLTFVENEVGVSSVITMAMILAIPVGFSATMAAVAGRAVLNEEAPQGKQGRVFATQSALSDALSLLPLFAIGGVAELVGVREVLLVAAITGLVAGIYLSMSRRFGPPPQPPPEPAAAQAG